MTRSATEEVIAACLFLRKGLSMPHRKEEEGPSTFIPGDVVELKLAPGLHMTVEKIEQTEGGRVDIGCVWFAADDSGPHRRPFDARRLRLVQRNPPGQTTDDDEPVRGRVVAAPYEAPSAYDSPAFDLGNTPIAPRDEA